ncbi:hypothetical protein Tco_0232823, partial [Tanacetum coccineum]
PPFEEETTCFHKRIGYPRVITTLSDVRLILLSTLENIRNSSTNVSVVNQTRLDQLRLISDQFIWGMYNQLRLTMSYLLCEDLVYQIENKVSREQRHLLSKIIKSIINHFNVKRSIISRREQGAGTWLMMNPILTTMRISSPSIKNVQMYGVILLDTTTQLSNEGIGDDKITCFATGKGNSKTKAEQMKIVTKRSKTQFHSSHASGSGADEGTGVSPGVPDVPTYGYEIKQIS